MSKAPYQPGHVKQFDNAREAYKYLCEIYKANTDYLRDQFLAYAKGKKINKRIAAHYPFVQISVTSTARVDTRLSYGFVPTPGFYRSTVTRPDIFPDYYHEQFSLLLKNHKVPLEIGISETPIPIHFAFGDDLHLEADLSSGRLADLPEYFDLPSLMLMDDTIVNGTYYPDPDEARPLSLFTAQRVDLSIQRLKHYTGTSAKHFQNFVVFTNYQFYVDEFVKMGRELMAASKSKGKKSRDGYTEFVEPGEWITPNQNLSKKTPYGKAVGRMPQMPAYHLKRADDSGITLINIGVGPSNAKTITDHVAVLRPHAWLMLGHCAGLRNSQTLGDYVLAHAYVRDDHVLDNDLPIWVPLPALSEIQLALEEACSHVTKLSGYDLKKILRTGTVATIDNRNWELQGHQHLVQRFSQSRVVALDMESATIAANGFRFRVPYGTLLCVSDKPLHGHLKLPGMADHFYRQRVDQHLKIGLRALEALRSQGHQRLHSRKLRSFAETAFR